MRILCVGLITTDVFQQSFWYTESETPAAADV